jgi:hypothetical protein
LERAGFKGRYDRASRKKTLEFTAKIYEVLSPTHIQRPNAIGVSGDNNSAPSHIYENTGENTVKKAK